MNLTNLQISKQTNTIKGGKIHVYDIPRYRISFDLSESELMGALKRTWRTTDYEEKAQSLGRKLLRRIKDWYGEWLVESIETERKLRKNGQTD